MQWGLRQDCWQVEGGFVELEDFKRGVQMRTAQGQWALPAGLPDLQGLPEAKLAPLASGTVGDVKAVHGA